MVTKGLQGKEDPVEYHKRCLNVVMRYYLYFKNESIEILDSSGVEKNFTGNRLEGLGRVIMEELSKADEIVFMDDWEKYDGCRCEHFIASQYGIKCIYLDSEFARRP